MYITHMFYYQKALPTCHKTNHQTRLYIYLSFDTPKTSTNRQILKAPTNYILTRSKISYWYIRSNLGMLAIWHYALPKDFPAVSYCQIILDLTNRIRLEILREESDFFFLLVWGIGVPSFEYIMV